MSFPYVPGRTVEVPEIPYTEMVELPAAGSALLVVDMQNDFVKQGGCLVVQAAMDTVGRIGELVSRAREAGVRIAFTQDTHLQDDPEAALWPEHCREGTWGWQIIEELGPLPGDLVCPKNRYDGFYGTWLEHMLAHVWKVGHLVIVGTVSSICVLHTAASAGLRWYHLVVPANGISALNEFDQALTLRQVSFLYTGRVVRSVSDIVFF